MKRMTKLFHALTFCLLGARLLAAEADGEFKSIFNGKDLSGWDGDPKYWSVKDGAITGIAKNKQLTHNTFIIWRDGKVDDFELHLKFKIIGGNSGIQYRSKESPEWVMSGYQADFEAGTTYSGILYEERGRGILAQRGQKVVVRENGKPEVVGSVGDSKAIQAAIKKEDWNDYTVIARGYHFIHRINGMTTVDVMDEDTDHRVASGLLALQLHAGFDMQVQFKDIQMKRLKLAENRKKVVLVAGKPSHGPGEHEFNAGVQLLDKCLGQQEGFVSTYYLNGWPKDPTAFDNADAILFYMDGGAGHPAIQENHIEILDALARKGVGLGFAHYAVEVPAGKGGEALQRWIGGYYEHQFSVNPMWSPEYHSYPTHPVTRGVKPFSVRDEWYFNMRWAENAKGLAQILVDKPSDQVRNGPYQYPRGPYEHIQKASGRPETMMWTFDRPDGGRGFGFTGGHQHTNWGEENFRKVVLNALVWIAKGEVPANGVESSISAEDLKQNLDPKGKKA